MQKKNKRKLKLRKEKISAKEALLDLNHELSEKENTPDSQYVLDEEEQSEEKYFEQLTEMGADEEYIAINLMHFDAKEMFEIVTSKLQFLINNDLGTENFSVKDTIKEAKRYDKRFVPKVISSFMRSGVKPEYVNQYDKRFDSFSILSSLNQGLDPKEANRYSNRFTDMGIVRLHKAGATPEIADAYQHGLKGETVAALYSLKIPPLKVPNPEVFVRNQDRLIEFYEDQSQDIKRILGTGASGIVILSKNNAFKISKYLEHEAELIWKVNCAHHGKQRHVVKGIGELTWSNYEEYLDDSAKQKVKDSEKIFAIELEHIEGDSLENIIKRMGPLPFDKVVTYSRGILQGLIELKEAGIYQHRDIRPANILIESREDRAVIIDLGIATTERYAMPKDNRRYGGPNDLVSLGQVMYKMATGKHIFAESKSMEMTIRAANIKDERDKAYSTEYGIDKYLDKINGPLQKTRLRDSIVFCLKSKGHYEDYKILKKIIEDEKE